MHRLLEHPTSVWVGRRSYGLYLWHYPVFAFFSSVGMPRPAAVVLKVGTSVMVAAASYRWIEQPFLKLKQRFRRTETTVLVRE